VIGFDTFSGFPHTHEQDTQAGRSEHLHVGGFRTARGMADELRQLAELHDRNRPLGHISKVEVVEGDACQTIPSYLEKNPHLLISLLYLDFDLYEPTKVALQYLLPRVVRGGIVAFDELNSRNFPGETVAFLEVIGDASGPLCRFAADPHISYFVK
jgi:Macrocin-O-methyltransferase (TylF)